VKRLILRQNWGDPNSNGEVELAMILEQFLSPEQYVKTRKFEIAHRATSAARCV
jgi:hypothetical protein